MRPSSIVAFLLSAGAFILSILILFSGRSPSFLPDVFLTKLDTSDIGTNIDVIPEQSNGILDRLGNRVEEFIDGVARTAANELGIHDSYSVHVLNYCRGDETAEDIKRNRTASPNWCSKQRASWYFDLTSVLNDDITVAGITTNPGEVLDRIGYPRESIDDIQGTVKTIQKAMIVFQIGAAAGTGLILIHSAIGVFIDSRFFAFLTAVASLITFLFVALASTLGTVVAVRLRDELRNRLSELNVRSYISSKYLGMTWAATGAMLLVMVYWFFQICFHGRKSHRRRDREAAPVAAKPAGRRRFGIFGRRRY